jgi:hypothetical protein
MGSKFLKSPGMEARFKLPSLQSTRRIINIVIQSLDFVAVEALIADLHPYTEGPECAHVLDGITDGLSRCCKTTVAGVTPCAALMGLVDVLSAILECFAFWRQKLSELINARSALASPPFDYKAPAELFLSKLAAHRAP